LAVTETGGDVLYIDPTLLPDGRGMTLTGQLGDVMQESARAAQSWILSHAADLQVDPKRITRNGVHVHVPAGAIPKDGPSAGVTMASALASLYTGRPVRHDSAMTGEITLTGLVLPVGGIKEKVLAARRAGLKRVVLPEANRNDLRELPENVRQEVEFVFVESIDEVLEAVIENLAGTAKTGKRRRNASGNHDEAGTAAAAATPAPVPSTPRPARATVSRPMVARPSPPRPTASRSRRTSTPRRPSTSRRAAR
jgi:ATP-dependent Lon protease